MWYIYILKCEDGSLYTGFTDNPERRFAEHNTKQGAKYTRSHKPVEILYTESFKNKGDALRRERQIKGWRREKKLALINN
jgi:putative endonuclease